MTFDIDGAEGTGRTDEFAPAATDAEFDIRFRNRERSLIRNHMERLRRAVLRAGAAARFLRVDDAVFLDEDDVTHLVKLLFLERQRKNGACRTDLTTEGAVVVAETVGEV